MHTLGLTARGMTESPIVGRGRGRIPDKVGRVAALTGVAWIGLPVPVALVIVPPLEVLVVRGIGRVVVATHIIIPYAYLNISGNHAVIR